MFCGRSRAAGTPVSPRLAAELRKGAPIRVAFVHSFYSSRQPSGENRVVQDECSALRRAGHEVGLFAAHTDAAEGDRLYALRSALRVATGRGRSPLDELRRFGPDLVHVHNLFPNFGRRWVEDLDVPVVHTLHNYRPLCANGLLYRDGHVCTDCPDGSTWSAVRHKCYRGSRPATAPIAWANRGGPARDPLLARADRLIVMSDRQRQVYVDAGVAEDKLQVWPNFLPDELDPGPALTPPGEREGWLFVGRLRAEKGVSELVAGWPAGHRLTVVGDGPMLAELRAAARGSDVRLTGPVPRATVVRLLGGSHGLVFPSKWYETFGLVYVEALAAGLPVVALAGNTVADMVNEDATGRVFERFEELGDTIRDTVAEGPDLHRRCRAAYVRRYTERSYLQRWHAAFAPSGGNHSRP